MHPQPIIASILVCGVIAVVAMVRPRGEELVFGDVIEVPAAARNDAGGRRKIRSDRLAQRTMDRTHVGSVI